MNLPRKWRRRAGITIAAIAVYAIVGFFVVPPILRSQIQTRSRQLLNREAAVERVRFNPFTLTTEITHLRIADRDGADLFSLDRLMVNLQVIGILRRAYRLKEVEVDRPHLVARILADGKPSIADLFESPQAPEPQAPAPRTAPSGTAKRPLARAIINRFVVRDGSVDFVDESRTPQFAETLAPLDLDVRDLSTIPREGGEHVVTVGIGQRTRIRWSGRQTVDPLRLEGRFELSAISLPRVWSYAAQENPLEVKDGSADVAWSYEVSRTENGDFAVFLKDGSISLNGVAVRPRGGTEDWLTVPSVEIRPIFAAWPASTIEIGTVKMTDPRALVRISQDGGINWQTASVQATPAPANAPTPSTPDVPARPWSGKIASIEIAGGTIHFEDLSVSPAVSSDLGEIGVHAENLSENLAAPLPTRISAKLNETGRLSLSGTIVPEPFGADLDVSAEGLDLVPLRTYAAVPNAELRSGVASLSGKLHVGSGAPRIRFDGEGSLDGLEVVDPAAARLLAWKGCRTKGIRLSLAPDRLRIGEVTLDQAFAKVAIDREGNLNLTRLAAAPATPARPPQAIPPIDITKVAISDAKIEYSDESLILPFGTDIHAANGSIKDLSTSSAAPARLDLEGRVADTGFLKAGGTLRVAEPFASSDVIVTFRDVGMPALTPYFAQFAGYAVKDGKLDLDIRYRVEDRHLVGDHRLVANQLVLGDKVEGASGPGFPVRLAIALLKDKDGRIDLEVPIEGTIDSPEFSYNKIFWQAVRKILANVAAAPFRAIGKLFGKDEEDLDLVGFASGRSDLLPPEQETLSKLAVELAKKPGVTVSVEGRYDPVADTEALKRANLEQRIDAKRATVESLESILEALFTETFSLERLAAERAKFTPPPAPAPASASAGSAAPAPAFNAAGFYDSLRSQLLGAVEVDPADLSGLAGARAQAIVAALTGAEGLEPLRVKAIETAPVKRKKQGSDLVASEMTLSADD